MFKKIKQLFRGISIDCLVTCVYFLCMPYTIVTTPFGSLLKLITMPVTAVLGYKLFFGKRKKLQLNSVHFTYSLYIAYSLIGLFFLVSNTAVVQTKDMMLTYLVMMLISLRLYNQREQELIEHIWIVVGIICVYLCLTSTQVANEFENRTIVYIMGSKEDPNQFCAYFIIPVMVCVKRIVAKKKLFPAYIVLLIFIMYAVLKTGSRGGLIGIVLGMVCCVFLGIKNFKAKIGFLIIGVVGALLVVTVIFPLLPEDVQSRYSVQQVEDDKGSGRFQIWAYLINYTAENPARLIHGSGMCSTEGILKNASEVEHVAVAHNQFVQVLTDQGMLGLLLFFIFIFTCVFRNRKISPFYACAFISVMAFSVSLTLYVFKPYINIIMMCAMGFEYDKSLELPKKGEKNEILQRPV